MAREQARTKGPFSYISYGCSANTNSQDADYFTSPHRGADGRFTPVAQVGPMDEQFIGGFYPSSSPAPPPLPLKDEIYNDPTFRLGVNASQRSISSSQLSQLTAVERSKMLRIARMNPHLQVSKSFHSRALSIISFSSSWLGPC